MSDTARDTAPPDELERLRGENECLRVYAAAANASRDEALRVIARVRQMADAWERTLPDTIRRDAAVQSIRDVTRAFEGRS